MVVNTKEPEWQLLVTGLPQEYDDFVVTLHNTQTEAEAWFHWLQTMVGNEYTLTHTVLPFDGTLEIKEAS